MVDTIEKYDETVKERQRIFGTESKAIKQEGSQGEVASKTPLKLSADILDISVHEGKRGLEILQKQPIYKLTNEYVELEKKAEFLAQQTVEFASLLNDKVYFPMREKIIFVYDEASQYISFMLDIVQAQQADLAKYVNAHYDNVKVILTDGWMRLDFDKDGIVSMEDFKKGLFQLYEFLRNFHYIKQTSTIKSQFYEKAVSYMKSEVSKF